MRSQKKDKKANEASDKEVVASVTEEMAQPRIAKSVKDEADEQSKARYGRLVRHHAGDVAKTQSGQYGPVTPAVKNES